MDQLYRHFLWFEGSNVKKNLLSCSMKNCVSKQRGLEIRNIKIMNNSLLYKWL
jgi:hypothetical protein